MTKNDENSHFETDFETLSLTMIGLWCFSKYTKIHQIYQKVVRK